MLTITFFYFFSSPVTDQSSGCDYDGGWSAVSAMIRYYTLFYGSQAQSDLEAAKSVTVKTESVQPDDPDAAGIDIGSDLTSTSLLPFEQGQLANSKVNVTVGNSEYNAIGQVVHDMGDDIKHKKRRGETMINEQSAIKKMKLDTREASNGEVVDLTESDSDSDNSVESYDPDSIDIT